MQWQVTTKPTTEPVTLDEVKLNSRIEIDADDDLLTSLIQTSREFCEQYQNKAYATQTITAKMDSFCSSEIELPCPPLVSVTSIKYYDISGVEQTVSTTVYDIDTTSEPGKIFLKYNQTWPSDCRGHHNDVTIVYIAGYSVSSESMVANTDIVKAGGYVTITTGGTNWGTDLGVTSMYWLLNQHNQRIRQSGTVTKFTVYFSAKPAAITHFYFMIWRNNGTTWDKISSEDIWTQVTAASINTITLTTPVAVQEGDYVGFGLTCTSQTGNFWKYLTGHAAAMYYVTNQTPDDAAYAWDAKTAITFYFPIYVYMQAPVMVTIGDSLISGLTAHRSYLEGTDTNSRTSILAYYLSLLTGYDYQNMGYDGHTTSQISARFAADCTALKPKVAVINGGINDIRDVGGDVTMATFLSKWTLILNACVAADIIPVVLLMLPATACTVAQMQERDTWNAALTELAAGYETAILVNAESEVGLFRAGGDTGNLWDIKVAYNVGDGLHYNAAGYSKIADVIYGVLQSEGVVLVSPSNLIPERCKQAIKLLVGHFYEHREDVSEITLDKIPTGVASLLSLDRIYPV